MLNSRFVTIKWFSISLLTFVFAINVVLFIALSSDNSDWEYDDIPNELLEMKDFKYLISKPKCTEEDNFLFITLIHAGALQFERRQAIRDTWSQSEPWRTKINFVLGASGSASLQRKLEAEDDKYNDIIQGNFMDTYHNLTYKHTMVLKWFSAHCPKVKYLLKGDDDVYVNTPAVYQYLSQMEYDPNFLMGMYWRASEPPREGKFSISEEQLVAKWGPEFAWGHSLIYASQVAKRFYQRASSTRFIWMDDVFFTGYVRMQFNIRITPTWDYKLWGEMLDRTVNGTLPFREPMFLFSMDSISGYQMRALWKRLEPYRLQSLALD